MSERKNFSHESWQDRMVRLAKEKEKAIEGTEGKRETYSREEIEKLQSIQRVLSEFSSTTLDTLQGFNPESEEYKDKAHVAIKEIITFLDEQKAWVTKFTTSSGGANDDLERTPHDSIYYMTESGLSLRLKIAAIALGDGFEKVIQPIMELILFKDPDSKMGSSRFSRIPKDGWSVKDYVTPAFQNLMSESSVKTDYSSPLEVYEKDGEVVGVVGPQDAWIHEGSKVNHIESIR